MQQVYLAFSLVVACEEYQIGKRGGRECKAGFDC